VIRKCIIVHDFNKELSLNLFNVINKWTTRGKMLKVSGTDIVEKYICTADALEDLHKECQKKRLF